MLVQGISLGNYRNYKNLHMEFDEDLNILVGDNAQGKTNILEAIFYACTGKSHRTNFDQELIYWGEKAFIINLVGERNSRKVKIEISARADGKKILKVNNQPKKKLSELIGIINVVLFSPEDMLLVKGGPSVRRRFLDIEISQTSLFYCHNLSNYNKVLFQRNNLLKAIREKKEKSDLLDIWDIQIVEYGSYIIKKRMEALEKIIPLARSIHTKITGGRENLNITYKPCLDLNNSNLDNLEDLFIKKLRENRNMEIIKGISMIGPHRDDITIKINDNQVKVFGSQGQQRTAALSMKLSELEYIKIESGEYPILLLDDVLSELDENRKKYMMEVVENKIQTFVTSTSVEDVFRNINKKGRIFKVQAGEICNVKEEG